LDLHPQIERALQAAKYETPTPIQAQAIPHLLEGRDMLGSAQTGTGKTAAYTLPILDYLGSESQRARPRAPQALILSPTRELAAQIGESVATYGKFLHLKHTVVFGGVGAARQIQALKKGVHILVATPGRLLDLMGQGFITLEDLEIFVLDEADRMLDMGFLPDLKRIIAELPDERQSLFFSATLPPKAAELAASLLQNPVRIEIAPESPTVERIEQSVLYVPQHEKSETLDKLLDGPGVGKVLVFTKTKRGADKVAKQLIVSGVKAEAIHGNKSQSQRTKTLDRFRSDRIDVLVATDVAARGIDVDGLSHVINYDLPLEAENYVHRIGRTGRAGASGIALSFCDPATERRLLKDIERLIRQSIPVHDDYPDKTPPSRGGNSQLQQRQGGYGHSRGPQGSRHPKSRPPHGSGRPQKNGGQRPKRPAKSGS